MIDKINNVSSIGTVFLGKVTAEKLNELIKYQKPIILQDASTVKWNLRKGYNAKIILGGNRTLFFEQLTPGDYGTLEIVQDSTGSRTLTLPSNSKVSNGGTGILALSTAANSIDIATFYYNGINIFWNLATNFS